MSCDDRMAYDGWQFYSVLALLADDWPEYAGIMDADRAVREADAFIAALRVDFSELSPKQREALASQEDRR